ncbi:MAG: tRNA (guanosine(46)-N7)-methyltransferase TrmB [Phycisphaerales bacterium]|nr:MAG: tRNA (guanosine(46)-N7)-methyltransferase TrmB [Phycisphaerales bacterium]
MARVFKEYASVALKAEELEGEIDFAELFGRHGPVHIEIGTGKATFLLNQAKAQPHVDFIGIEWARKYYRFAVDRMGRWGVTNVRIIRTDAAAFIRDHIAEECVDCFHIYFPDPWPKKRHHKRRLLSPANLEQMIRCLGSAGQIRIATDHSDYFERIQTVIRARSNTLEEIEFLPTAGAKGSEWVGTNFERKYHKESRPVYTLAVQKTEPNSAMSP